MWVSNKFCSTAKRKKKWKKLQCPSCDQSEIIYIKVKNSIYFIENIIEKHAHLK